MAHIAITTCSRLEDYKQAILHTGGEVRVVDSSMSIADALDGSGGLMLTGGDDVEPARYGEEAHPSVVRVARERSLPVREVLDQARADARRSLGG